MPGFRYFWAEILKKTIAIFEINAFDKVRLRVKMRNFRTKNSLFGYFWVEILKNYCPI